MGWTKMSIPRIRFRRIGNDESLDWSVTRGVKFVYTSIAGSTGSVQFDTLFVTAGADGRALTGTFRARYKFVFNDEKFTDESLPSPVSDKVGLIAEGLQVVIPRNTAINMDPQTTHIWVYIWSAAMGAFYRTLDPINLNRSKRTLNEWGVSAPDYLITADDRMRILTVGMRYGRRYVPGTDPITYISVPGSPTSISVTDSSNVVDIAYATGPGATGTPPVLSWDTSLGQVDVGFSMNTLPITVATITSITSGATFNNAGNGNDIFFYFIVVISGVIYKGVLASFPSDGASYSSTQAWTTDPSTGAAWTVAGRNNAYFGVEFAANAQNPNTNLTAFSVTNVYETAGGAGTVALTRNALTFNIQTSEAELLMRNEKLATGRESVPDNVISIVGSHFDRTLCLTKDTLYFSDPLHPGVYPALQAIKIGDGENEIGLWMHKAAGSVYIGTTKDIYRLSGDLVEFPNGLLNASLLALNMGSPPVDNALAYEGNALVYRASDGPRMLVGEASTPLQGDLALLARGHERHGVPAIPVGGRHRLAMADGYLYWTLPPVQDVNRRNSIAEFIPPPTGTITASGRRRILTVGRGIVYTSTVLRYDFADQKWSYRPYSRVIRSVVRTLEGDVLAGTSSGEVLTLDTGTTDAGNLQIPVNLLTTQQDDGKPLSRKVPFDLSVRLDTGGEIVTIGVYLDGSETAATTFEASASGQQVFVASLASLSPFRRIQLRFEGEFNTFKLYDWNVSYRDMPQHHYYVDTGNVETGSEYYRWFREIVLLAKSDNDLNVDVYFDDVLLTTETITVTPGITGTYVIPLGRTVRGRQPRVVVRTTASSATGEEGFELYWVQWRMRPSGDATQKPVIKWSAVGK